MIRKKYIPWLWLHAVCMWIMLFGYAIAYADTSNYRIDSQVNEVSIPAATVGDDGRVFIPSRLFSRRGASANETFVERSTAADPSQVENQKLEAKAQELLLRADSKPNALLTGSFADFVKSSVGSVLPIYGYDLFTHSDRFGLNVDPLSVPADYRVGPGDEIIVKVWGQIDINFQGTVDRTGAIFIPKVGSIVVNGQQVADLLPLIAKSVAQKYHNFEMTVTLGQLRQIQYYVMGMANFPGVHTTDSTATVLHALLAAGGPSVMGDLRAIELKRNNQTIATVDAYSLLTKGDRSTDIRILPGDVIFIPPAKGYIAIAGDVKQPAIFHLKAGMTIADAVQYAGGLSIKGSRPNMRLERLVQGKRTVEFFALNPSTAGLRLQDGDIVLISPISPKIENAVTLRGNVAEPLRQPWADGMRVSDLITSLDQLIRPAVWTQRNDRAAFNKLDFLKSNVRIKDDFTDINWSYATIERIDPQTLKSSIISFELDKALLDDPQHNLALQAGDTVTVFSTKDFNQPAYKEQQLIKIDGEVNRPGTYTVNVGETVYDVIERAGGITPNAYLYGLFLSRERIRAQEAAKIGLAADKIEEDFYRYIASRATNAATSADKELSGVELESTKRMIGRLRSVPTQGRVVLNISDPYAVESYIHNVTVEDGDTITIPPKATTVTVSGAVFQQTTFQWRKGADSRDYIRMAGGMKKVADDKKVLVLRFDGSIWQADGGWLGDMYAINPGDTIFVQEEVAPQSKQKFFGDWSQILYQMGLGTVAIKTLLNW